MRTGVNAMIGGLTGILATGAFGAASAFRDGVQRGSARQAQIEMARKSRRDVAAVRGLGAELRATREALAAERRRADAAEAEANRLMARLMRLEAAARR